MSIWELIKLSRAGNLLIIILTQYMVAFFLVDNPAGWTEILQDAGFFIMVLGTVTIAAAGYFINDYYDVKIDMINKPDRVIVGRKLKRRTVMLLHLCLNAVGVILGAWVALRIGLVNFIAAFLLWFYSNDLKRRPFIGNLTVALLTGVSLILVGLYFGTNELLIFIYAFFAFGITLIREIVKDLEDMKGDLAFGAKSLPIVLGIRKTKLVVYVLILIFVLSLVLFISRERNVFLTNYFLALLLPVGYLVYRIYKADTKQHFYMLSQHLKWLILTGVLSMIFVN